MNPGYCHVYFPSVRVARQRYTFETASIPIYNDRLQELICNVLVIILLDHPNDALGSLSVLSFSLHQTVHGDCDSFPALVTIHCIVPAHNGRQLAVTFLIDEVKQILAVASGRAWSCITPVREKVHVGVRNTNLLSGFQQGVEVSYVRVYSAVRDLTWGNIPFSLSSPNFIEGIFYQAKQMQSSVAILCTLEAVYDGL